MLALRIAALIFCFFGGLVLHRFVARRFFDALDHVSEREVLLHGPVASIIVNGTVGTFLALFHAFHLAAFFLVFVAAAALLRRDAAATLSAIASLSRQLLGDLLQLRLARLAAIGLWAFVAVVLATLSRIPAESIDTWAFQLPLAYSVIDHHGFVYPQIDHVHYANQPLFVNLLFAQMMLVAPHFLMASLASVAIFVCMLLALAASWGKQRYLALGLVTLLIGWQPIFASGVPVPLTDMPRSCLSILGYAYLALFLYRRYPYYAALAAACLGAAIASKYTELLSLPIAGLCAIPLLRERNGWKTLGGCALILSSVGGYWYAKNLLLLGNPIYPFLFGHPGLSDAWVADYMQEMTRAFDPQLRHLSRNLLTSGGWTDFLNILWSWFFENRLVAKLVLFASLAGAWAFPRLILPLLLTAATLFVVWYVVMFNHTRWAIPAYLLLHVTGCYAVLCFATRSAGWTNRLDIAGRVSRALPSIAGVLPEPGAAGRNLAWGAIGLVVAVLLLSTDRGAFARKVAARLGVEQSVGIVLRTLPPGGMDEYLDETRPGYLLYRTVVQQDLRKVFQPYDNGVKLYAAAYNGGRDGEWFVGQGDMPGEIASARRFVDQFQIKYFIERRELLPVEIERFGPERMKLAGRIIATLVPHAELMLEDNRGWRLYRLVSEPPD